MPRFVVMLLFMPGVAAAQSPIAADERVIFFPTLGRLSDDGSAWLVHVHGWIFEPAPSEAALRTLEDLLDLEDQITDPAERRLFRRRLQSWLVDNERGKTIEVRIGARRYTAGTSTPNGHFQRHVVVPLADLPETLPGPGQVRLLNFEAVTRPGDRRVFQGQVRLLPPRGLSVISDIDDTIRITEVRDRKAMLGNTFLRPFRPVPGMAEVYADWQARHAAVFHYLSASPYQLYEHLDDFLRSSGFPPGSLHLKPVRLKDRTLMGLFDPPEEYKALRIAPLLEAYPQRTFICVGDSGEKDPEVYGELARAHPGRIVRIFIRDTTGESPDGPRYRAAFRDLPAETWRVFTNPDDIRAGVVIPATVPAGRSGS